MAWYDVPPKLAGGRPAPLYWDEELQDWVAPHGRKGVPGKILYGPDGQPISVVEHKLAVRASELEAKMDALKAEIIALKNGETNEVDVKLKGSLVEMYKTVDVISNFTVAAGALATIYTYDSNTDPVDMISVLVKAPSTEIHDYSVYYQGYIGGYTSPAFSKLLGSSNNSYIAYTE